MTIPNSSGYEDWNGESGLHWVGQADLRDQVLAAVAVALLELADLQVAEAVLDVGCGCGATTLAAGRAVGPHGSVLGIDISEVMLGAARQRVAHVDLGHVTLIRADAQTHRFGQAQYDVAVSRFGTMFFDDPVTAFTNIADALRPGGRLLLATWQPLSANPWLTIPGAALLRFGSLPETTDRTPGMFAQSDPGMVTRVLRASGFTDIEVQARTVPLHLGHNESEAAAYLASTSMGRAVLETIPEAQQAAALEAVRDVLAEHRTPSGVQIPGGILLTTARAQGRR